MKQEFTGINFNGNNPVQIAAKASTDAIAFNKPNDGKPCQYRTANGYCTRSNQQCSATFSTIILNN